MCFLVRRFEIDRNGQFDSNLILDLVLQKWLPVLSLQLPLYDTLEWLEN